MRKASLNNLVLLAVLLLAVAYGALLGFKYCLQSAAKQNADATEQVEALARLATRTLAQEVKPFSERPEPCQRHLAYRLLTELSDHYVEVTNRTTQPWNSLTIRIGISGEVLTWEGHPGTTFVRHRDVLYLSDYYPLRTGCAVIAFDLNTRKQLWRSHLIGVPCIGHSKYSNVVDMEFKDNLVVVYGWESAGRYIEKVDPKTGESVYHKLLGTE